MLFSDTVAEVFLVLVWFSVQFILVLFIVWFTAEPTLTGAVRTYEARASSI